MRDANGIPMSDLAFDFIFGGGEEDEEPERDGQKKGGGKNENGKHFES